MLNGELRRWGWRARGAAAAPSQAGGPATGGLLTCVRNEHGVAPMLGERPSVLREGRVHLLHHAGLTPGGVVAVNARLESGVGVDARNFAMLRDPACRLRECGRP